MCAKPCSSSTCMASTNRPARGELVGGLDDHRLVAGRGRAGHDLVLCQVPPRAQAQDRDQVAERVEQDAERDRDHDPEGFGRQVEVQVQRLRRARKLGLQIEPTDGLIGGLLDLLRGLRRQRCRPATSGGDQAGHRAPADAAAVKARRRLPAQSPLSARVIARPSAADTASSQFPAP